MNVRKEYKNIMAVKNAMTGASTVEKIGILLLSTLMMISCVNQKELKVAQKKVEQLRLELLMCKENSLNLAKMLEEVKIIHDIDGLYL